MSARRPRPSEASLVELAAAHLRAQGYRTYVDPDGGSYFDLAAARDEEVGLVEGKVGRPREVLVQALKRRAWADWVAVVVESRRAAEALVARTTERRAEGVGVWAVDEGVLVELRAARPRRSSTEDDPFAPLRARLRDALRAIDRGEVPAGVGWAGVPRAVRAASSGRSFAEWRLDETLD